MQNQTPCKQCLALPEDLSSPESSSVTSDTPQRQLIWPQVSVRRKRPAPEQGHPDLSSQVPESSEHGSSHSTLSSSLHVETHSPLCDGQSSLLSSSPSSPEAPLKLLDHAIHTIDKVLDRDMIPAVLTMDTLLAESSEHGNRSSHTTPSLPPRVGTQSPLCDGQSSPPSPESQLESLYNAINTIEKVVDQDMIPAVLNLKSVLANTSSIKRPATEGENPEPTKFKMSEDDRVTPREKSPLKEPCLRIPKIDASKWRK